MGPSSARTVQGAMRGHIARNIVRARTNEIMQSATATRIQKVVRGHQSMNESTIRNSPAAMNIPSISHQKQN